MAKKHIRFLTKKLLEKYNIVEETMTRISLSLQDTLLSPEQQVEFSAKKTQVDETLKLFSISLSAAAQGKIDTLITKNKTELQGFALPLTQAIDNLSTLNFSEEYRAQTEQLIVLFNSNIRKLEAIRTHLELIRFYASIPNRDKKSRKWLKGKDLETLYYTQNLFSAVDATLQEFISFSEGLTAEVQLSSPEDDLQE